MKYNEDFTTIDPEVYEKISKAVNKQNCTPIMVCRLTNHPEDERLFVIIARYNVPNTVFDNAYVVWEANVFGENASLFYGHYHISFKTALEIITDKVRDLNKEEEEM